MLGLLHVRSRNKEWMSGMWRSLAALLRFGDKSNCVSSYVVYWHPLVVRPVTLPQGTM